MKCPKCGVDNPDTSKFCSGCGVSMQSSQAPAKGGLPLGKNMLMIIIAVVAVVAVVAVFLLFFSGPSECPKTCDDGNPCTGDRCSSETGFRCVSDKLEGDQTGCGGTASCVKSMCVSGGCTRINLDNCCGNSKCEAGEACTTCPDCKCEMGEACTNSTQCKTGNCMGRKCKAPGDKCGDDVCEAPAEDCSVCEDCYCEKGYECKDKACVLVDIPKAIDEGKPVVCEVEINLNNTRVTIEMKYELPKERVFMRASKGGITVENTVITSDGVTYYLNDPYYGEDSWYARTFDPSSGDYDVGEDVKELMENESVTIECEIVDDIPDSEFQLPRGAEIASTGLPAAASEAELMSKWMNDPLEALAKPSL